ncbi:MAG: DUF1127 domain-containing protein [Pseudomonadota bacterium]
MTTYTTPITRSRLLDRLHGWLLGRIDQAQQASALQDLLELDDHLLRDIGVSRDEVRQRLNGHLHDEEERLLALRRLARL